jgi:hypothetical protein
MTVKTIFIGVRAFIRRDINIRKDTKEFNTPIFIRSASDNLDSG